MLMRPYCYIAFFSIALEPWPVSSSGHALAYQLYRQIAQDSVITNLNYATHIPILFVMLLFFGRQWLAFICNLLEQGILFKFLISGFVIQSVSVLGYYILYCYTTSTWKPTVGFFLTTLILFSLRFCPEGRAHFTPSIANTIIIALAQALAFIPGVSRLAITFASARWLGVTGPLAFSLSFLVGLPLNIAAGFLTLIKLKYCATSIQILHPLLLSTMVMSGIGAYAGLYAISSLVLYNYLWYIAWYEICITFLAFLGIA